MKTKLALMFAALVAVSDASAQSIINDPFTGSSLNASNWTASVPFGDSAATVSGGSLTLLNGAGILSVPSATGIVEVMFTFAFTGNTHDSLRVYTRADQFYPNGYAIQHGVGVSFRIQEDGGSLVNNVALENNGATLVAGTIALSPNTSYTAKLVDTGTNLM